jgi:hypothetical protein
VWPTAKAEVFSVTPDLEGTGEKLRFMKVPNKPKPNRKPAPQKPAA